MQISLKNQSTFEVDEIIYSYSGDNKLNYIIRINCENEEHIEDLLERIQTNFTTENISSIFTNYSEESRANNEFNFKEILQFQMTINDIVAVIEIILR